MQESPLDRGLTRTQDLRVLNLDDNEVARYARSATLRRGGFTILEASTGAEALTVLDTNNIDVAILDVDLPDMSGLEVARRMREDPSTRSIKIVQISAGYLDERDEISSLQHGADVYLRLPHESDELSNVVDTLGRIRKSEILVAACRAAAVRPQETVGAVQLDMAGYVVAANRGYCEMLRRAPQELCLLALDQLVYAKDAGRVTTSFREMIRGEGRDFRTAMRQVAGDGSLVSLDCSFSVMRSITGAARGALCSVMSAAPAGRPR
jgi:CheY-like chemotaxis protein